MVPLDIFMRIPVPARKSVVIPGPDLHETDTAFQQAPVWRVEPDLDRAATVLVVADVAYIHIPLTLVIGSADAPDRLRFLVSILFQRQGERWVVAALFTTTAKPE